VNPLQFLFANRMEILARTAEHLWLVALALGIALLAGLPLGVALVRR